MGGAEFLSGGGTAVGGGAFAIVTSPSGVGAVAGGAVAAGGVAIAAHGAMTFAMAAKNMAGQKAKIDNASNETNGNSKSSTKAQHNYDVVDTKTGKVVKTGVSGGKETKTGQSYRGNYQANKWNRQEGTPNRYKSKITNRVPAGRGARQNALEYEKARAEQLRDQLDPRKHQRP